MPVYALTGVTGSGKSTLLEYFRKKGARVFDADKAVHRCYRDRKSAVYKKVVCFFPQAVSKSGTIERRKLRDMVIADHRKLRQLESAVHPAVIKDLKQWVTDSGKRKGIFIAEVPLLYEKKLAGLFDAVIFVDAPVRQLIPRIKKCLGVSTAEARRQLALFKSAGEKKRKSRYYIKNDKTKGIFIARAARLWQQLTGPAGVRRKGTTGVKKHKKS